MLRYKIITNQRKQNKVSSRDSAACIRSTLKKGAPCYQLHLPCHMVTIIKQTTFLTTHQPCRCWIRRVPFLLLWPCRRRVYFTGVPILRQLQTTGRSILDAVESISIPPQSSEPVSVNHISFATELHTMDFQIKTYPLFLKG